MARPAEAARSNGSIARISRQFAVRLRSMTSDHVSGLIWPRGEKVPNSAALPTRMSSRPQRSRTFAASSSILMKSRRSTGTRVALPPAARTASSTSSRPPTVRAARTTCAPSAAKRIATAAPIPREAPVISASLSAKRPRCSPVIRLGASGCLGGRRGPPKLPPGLPLPHYRQGDDAEARGEHQIKARRQAVPGHGDQPGRDEWRKAAEDRYRDAVAERHADATGLGREQLGHQGREHAAIAGFDEAEPAGGEDR